MDPVVVVALIILSLLAIFVASNRKPEEVFQESPSYWEKQGLTMEEERVMEMIPTSEGRLEYLNYLRRQKFQ